MKFSGLLKAKALIAIVAGVLLVGGATAAFASTSVGQNVVQSLTHAHPTVSATATQEAKHNGQHTGKSNQGQTTCPGLSDAENLATKYHLSTTTDTAIFTPPQATFTRTPSRRTTITATSL